MRVTLANINKAIRAAGSDFELVRGRGYFYFISETHVLYEESVHLSRLTIWTVEQWLDALRRRIDDTNARHITAADIPQLAIEPKA